MTKSEGRRFAFPVGLAFLALGGLTLWRGHGTVAALFGGLATVLFLAGALVPDRLGPVHRAWMAMAMAISKVTTPIFLGIVYFLVVAPTGLVMRLLGRNPLRREPSGGSYWVKREPGPARRSDMNRQF